MEQIILDNVDKKYGGRYVLREISHTFAKGESTAFMGKNGCGKSTLLKVIAGLTVPTSGNVIYSEPIRFSYVPEKFMPIKMTARTYLRRMGEIENIERSVLEERIKQLGDEFFVSELMDLSMQSLSKGTLQKIGVIQAMLKKPDVLLLDEPLSGQDAASQKVFVKKINALREEGTTIFMSCHEQWLVNAISEQTFTIQNGKLCPYEDKVEPWVTFFIENSAMRKVSTEMERYGTGYQIKVKEAEAQKTLLRLLQDGWSLKGMSND